MIVSFVTIADSITMHRHLYIRMVYLKILLYLLHMTIRQKIQKTQSISLMLYTWIAERKMFCLRTVFLLLIKHPLLVLDAIKM